MNLQARLVGTTIMIVAALGLTHTIAAEPSPQTAQHIDACRRVDRNAKELYTISKANPSITICQKGNQYYYITANK